MPFGFLIHIEIAQAYFVWFEEITHQLLGGHAWIKGE